MKPRAFVTLTLALALVAILMTVGAVFADVKDPDNSNQTAADGTYTGTVSCWKNDKAGFLDSVCFVTEEGKKLTIEDGKHKDIRHHGKDLKEAGQRGDRVTIDVKDGEITGVRFEPPEPAPSK